MKLVILAGGLGTRLSEETYRIPKPMVKIGKMPIIWHIMQHYSNYGINDFIICGGYKYQIIKKFFSFKKNINSNWNVSVIYTGKNSNTGERIKRIKKYVDDTFLLTYGDGLSDINISKLIKFHQKFKGIVTLSSVKPIPKYGKILFKKNLIKRFLEKDTFREDWINGGFFVCNKDLFDYFTKKNSVFESDVLDKLAKIKNLQGYKHTGFWYCMDTLRDKNFLNEIYKKGYTPWIKKEKKELMNDKFWKNKKVFITGHTDFKGSWLSVYLYSLGAKIYGYSLKETNNSIFHFAKVISPKNKINSFKNSDYIMRNGILIGCHQGPSLKHINYIHTKIKSFLKKTSNLNFVK